MLSDRFTFENNGRLWLSVEVAEHCLLFYTGFTETHLCLIMWNIVNNCGRQQKTAGCSDKARLVTGISRTDWISATHTTPQMTALRLFAAKILSKSFSKLSGRLRISQMAGRRTRPTSSLASIAIDSYFFPCTLNIAQPASPQKSLLSQKDGETVQGLVSGYHTHTHIVQLIKCYVEHSLSKYIRQEFGVSKMWFFLPFKEDILFTEQICGRIKKREFAVTWT